MKLRSGAENFGIIIAFLVPGFVSLWGASYHSASIRGWFATGQESAPTVGGFLYVTVASIAAGVAVSGLRWFVIDIIWCAIWQAQRHELDFENLPGKEDAFSFINENHYRYYQYYANMLIAGLMTYVSRFFARYFQQQDLCNKREIFLFIVLLIVEVVLGVGAWDARRKFYERGKAILSGKGGT